MTDDRTPGDPTKEFPEIGEDLSRQEIMDVLAEEGYPAGGRKGWLKKVLTYLGEQDGKAQNGNRDELVAEIKDVLDDHVSGDPNADKTL